MFVGAADPVPFTRELEQDLGVLRVLDDLMHPVDNQLYRLQFGHDLAGLLPVIPEAGARQLVFKFFAAGDFGWKVKESPGSR